MASFSYLYRHMGDQHIFWLACLALAAAVVRAFFTRKPLLCFPSLAWLFLSVLPFCLLCPFFPLDAARLQALGIGSIGLSLAASDFFLIWRIHTARPSLSGCLAGPRTPAKRLVLLLVIFIVVVPLTHLALSNHIPLVYKIFGEWTSKVDLAKSREQFSKLLEAPYFLKIFFQWTFVVVGPLLILTFFFQKKFYAAAATFVWVAIYSLLSLAKLPLVILLTMCGVGLLFRLRTPSRMAVSGIVILVLAVWFLMGAIRGCTLASWYAMLAPDQVHALSEDASFQHNGIPLSPGDISRLAAPLGKSVSPEIAPPATFGEVFDNLLYRTILTPMEVSNRWYLYYLRYPIKKVAAEAFLPILRKPGWRHPANVVGVWAYTERFPDHYLSSISAYASIDADAFGHFGRLGLGIACAVLLLMRLAGGLLYVDDATGNTLFSLGIAQMVIFPFEASFQAILVPQGFVLLLLLQTAWKWKHR